MANYRALALSLLLLTLLAGPAPVLARTDHSTRMQHVINRWVERVEEQMARLMDRYCNRFERYQERYGSDLPGFCEESVSPEPSPTPTPTPSPTPTPTVTPTPSPSPTPTATPTPTPTPTPSPSPTPSPTPSGNIILSEVFYDVDGPTHGTSADEWVEIYNDSGSSVDLSGYVLQDNLTSDTLPEGTTIPANGYLVVVSNAGTSSFWTIPNSAPIANLESPIGNGLGNGGDVVHLKDSSGTTVDSVSWGSDSTAFDPSAPDVSTGSSLARTDVTTDSNTANDWAELTTPTPGQ